MRQEIPSLMRFSTNLLQVHVQVHVLVHVYTLYSIYKLHVRIQIEEYNNLSVMAGYMLQLTPILQQPLQANVTHFN